MIAVGTAFVVFAIRIDPLVVFTGDQGLSIGAKTYLCPTSIAIGISKIDFLTTGAVEAFHADFLFG
jgi:hypothetical protein